MAVTITTRVEKGSELTFEEMDANFNNLKQGIEDLEQSSGEATSLPKSLEFIERVNDIPFQGKAPNIQVLGGTIFMFQDDLGLSYRKKGDISFHYYNLEDDYIPNAGVPLMTTDSYFVFLTRDENSVFFLNFLSEDMSTRHSVEITTAFDLDNEDYISAGFTIGSSVFLMGSKGIGNHKVYKIDHDGTITDITDGDAEYHYLATDDNLLYGLEKNTRTDFVRVGSDKILISTEKSDTTKNHSVLSTDGSIQIIANFPESDFNNTRALGLGNNVLLVDNNVVVG